MKPNQQTGGEPPSNAFLVLLADTGNGSLVAEASKAQAEIIKFLGERGGKGSLTVKMEFASTGNGQIAFTYDVSSKLPKPKSKVTIRYCTPEGGLQKNDPVQREMSFAVHDAPEDERPKIHSVI